MKDLLSKEYHISKEALEFYRENKFIKLKDVFDAETLDYYSHYIDERVEQNSKSATPMESRDTYGKAFLQIFNLWTLNPEIKDFVINKRLGSIAKQLMETQGVRVYHDQALYKEAGGGITPWHADQYYWPLSSDKTITAWIPLQPVPLEMGPLEFSAGSHAITEGRSLAISDESEKIISKKVTDFKHVIEPFDLGEVSFHSGWIFHRAGANQTKQTRKVMTCIYMDSQMRLKEPENKNQLNDWETWCPGAKIDEIINTPLNPTL